MKNLVWEFAPSIMEAEMVQDLCGLQNRELRNWWWRWAPEQIGEGRTLDVNLASVATRIRVLVYQDEMMTCLKVFCTFLPFSSIQLSTIDWDPLILVLITSTLKHMARVCKGHRFLSRYLGIPWPGKISTDFSWTMCGLLFFSFYCHYFILCRLLKMTLDSSFSTIFLDGFG